MGWSGALIAARPGTTVTVAAEKQVVDTQTVASTDPVVAGKLIASFTTQLGHGGDERSAQTSTGRLDCGTTT